jgi:hypothetical protein
MKRLKFWQFLESERQDLHLLLKCLVIWPLLLARLLVQISLLMLIGFYLGVVLPTAVLRLTDVFPALR